MRSINPSNNIAKEKRRSTSRLNHRPNGKGKTARRFAIAMAAALVVSSLLIELADEQTTHAATNVQHSASNTSVPSNAANAEKKLHYTAVEGAYYYTVALRSDGSVWTWGRNLFGELGVSENIRYRHTSSPIRIPVLSNVTAISAAGGGINAAVQADGTVWEWGAGKLPSKVESINSAKDVVSGSFTVALLHNGTVWSWQRPTAQGSDSDLIRKPHAISGLKDVIQVGSAGLHGYALKKDGSVWTWNEPDEPGKILSKPTKIKGLTNISSITSTDTSLLALDKNGKVWGLDETGKAFAFHYDFKVKKMDGNSQYMLLLTTSGEVYSYGRSVNGKEGKVNHLSGITDISAGYYHSLALSSDGAVWGWGSDKYEEAGAPATSSGGMVYKPVQAKIGTDVYLNGELFQSMYAAVETAKTVQLPIKAIAAALGAEFEIHQVEGSLNHYTLTYDNRTITIQPNETQYVITSADVSGERVMQLPEPINNYSGATTVPFEVLRGLGLNVSWDSEKAMLTIDDADKKESGS
ncbi:stalk domain-containing protein [Paenibacillus sp. OK076]|uniref:stalk domain-containing protein n=1 Tax=Paenibacillus sp. OK076 TaxID=1884379 RepID=UPI0008AEB734|nr:stalk domain-containing protein [Paenibacillus sp. OK076]SEM73663.1 Regulator of chromosome condensation (RCC1) repeat-containing protein [Paenibacillus sp. OK076]